MHKFNALEIDVFKSFFEIQSQFSTSKVFQVQSFVDCFQIERIKISFDGGKTSMNFAEAALVIQGSACIYSKKVLH